MFRNTFLEFDYLVEKLDTENLLCYFESGKAMLGWKSDKGGNHFKPESKKNKIQGVSSSIKSQGIRKHKFLKRHDDELADVEEAETPEIKILDEQTGIYYTWYGGESHYVHLEDKEGKEFNVFSFGFEKNKLDPKEVKKKIMEHIKEDRKERNGE